MAVLKKGKYKGLYKLGDKNYHTFSPDVIALNGETQYVRIGNYNEVFANDRNYILIEVNEEEQKLIDKNSV